MSLIRMRLRRKKNWIDSRKGMHPARLIAFLILTAAVIWYLGWRF